MSTTHAHILTLMSIGQLSIDLRRAELVADDAKHEYHAAWRLYECFGEPEYLIKSENRIGKGHPG